jgi:hypothetical protein
MASSMARRLAAWHAFLSGDAFSSQNSSKRGSSSAHEYGIPATMARWEVRRGYFAA